MTITDTQPQLRKASRLELIAFGLAAIGTLAGFVSMLGLLGILAQDAGGAARDIALLVFVAAFCVKTIEARIRRDLPVR